MESKLAINGGEPTINIGTSHYTWPPITERTQQAVLRQLNDNISIYNRSGVIEELENKFTEYQGTKYSLLTNSGTTALYSLFVGAGLTEGDEVICPVYTFYATVTPVLFTGATPVLVDCRGDGNIDPEEIKKKINERTKAIIVTHMWGIPCDMTPIVEIAKQHNLLLFEDASHAHGAIYKDTKVGSFGDGAAFSLQSQKTVAAGEGGVLVTNSEEIYYKALMLGHYNKRCKQEIPKSHSFYQFAVTGMGLKLRIHPLGAAIASEQFDNLDKILESRRKIADEMIYQLEELPGIRVPAIPTDVKPTWYAFILQYHSEELNGLPIQKFYQALLAEGCKELDRPGSTCPLHHHALFHTPEFLFPDYKDRNSMACVSFPQAEHFHANSLKLPVWHDLENLNVVELYLKAIKKVIKYHHDIL